MHELAVTESILTIARKHAQQNQAAQVTDIHLSIGRLSSIVDDSISFYWDIISRDTICEKACLHFHRLPASLVCLGCGNEYQIESDLTPCPKCQSAQVKVLAGNEFQVDSIEIRRVSDD